MKSFIFTALAFLIAFCSTASAQNKELPMSKVADGVYHFWAMGYSSMVVIGNTGVLITDPAITPRAKLLKMELSKVTDKPVTHVVLSHEHFDHIGGTEVFEGAEIILQENGIDVLKLSPLIPTPEVSTTFDNRMTIDLGTKTVELSQPAIGDGAASTVVRAIESNVIFTADLYMPREFSTPEFKEDTNMVGTSFILNMLSGWNISYAINSHSPGNSIEALRENAQFFNELKAIVEEKLQKALETGDPEAPWNVLFAMSKEVKMPKYSSWKNYDTIFPAYVRRMALSVLHGG